MEQVEANPEDNQMARYGISARALDCMSVYIAGCQPEMTVPTRGRRISSTEEPDNMGFYAWNLALLYQDKVNKKRGAVPDGQGTVLLCLAAEQVSHHLEVDLQVQKLKPPLHIQQLDEHYKLEIQAYFDFGD